jgi:thiol-disulfide isomerase/thioredoxin
VKQKETIMKPALLGLITLTILALLVVSAVSFSHYKLYQGFQDKPYGETNSRGTFTLYYADWCPHCKTIKPVFKDFMGGGVVNVDGNPVTVKMVEEKQIKKGVDPEVQGYPSLLYSDAAGKIVEFNGPRTSDGFMEFLKTQILS